MIAYKHLFENARPISFDDLDLFGVPASTIRDFMDAWEDLASEPYFAGPDDDELPED